MLHQRTEKKQRIKGNLVKIVPLEGLCIFAQKHQLGQIYLSGLKSNSLILKTLYAFWMPKSANRTQYVIRKSLNNINNNTKDSR